MRVAGVDGVELDVRLAADGVAIVLHDPTLDRVQGRAVRAAAIGSAELAGLGVPTLEAVLDAVAPSAFLDVELKVEAVAQVVEVVRAARGDPPSRVALSSFQPGVLSHAAVLAPAWPRWLNAERLDEEAIAVASALGCSAVSAGWRSIGERSMALASEAALEVAAWTVTSVEVAARLAALGVTAICAEGEALGPQEAATS
jgi:glycerophosphoryl diester phosphodiesterase